MSLLRYFYAVLAVLVGLGAGNTASAQQYPTRPITLVIAYSAGGQTDIICRLIAEEMSTHLGQPVVVENRAGAGGALGMDVVARAAPDGYTLSYGALSNVILVPVFNQNVPYDPVKDFVPIGLTAAGVFTIAVNPNVPAKTVPELMAWAKANSGKVKIATVGAGSTTDIMGRLFAKKADFKAVHVPYPGASEALQGTIRGDTDIDFEPVQAAIQLTKTGQLRVLAVTSAERSPSLPELPTATEAGLPGFVVTSWHAILAPKGTPPAIVTRLSDALKKSLDSPKIKEKMTALGVDPKSSTPDGLASLIKTELETWASVK